MHWWEFCNLLNGLSNSEMGNCCILNRIRNLRNYDTSKIKDAKQRQMVEEAKRQVALRKPEKKYTNEEKENMKLFFEQIEGDKNDWWPEGASTAQLTPEGILAYVTKYAESTTGVDVSGLNPTNVTAIVSAYKELASGTDVSLLKPSEITAYV